MVTTTAPARVDLAGGTLDIWPVCHLLELPALTVNCAIGLRARAEAVERDDGWVEITSVDRGETVRLRADALSHDRLGIATRLIEACGAGSGVTLRMESRVPPGSGLGGSSALAVAVGGALWSLRGERLSSEPLRHFVQTVETRLLRVPTGYQDYYPAILGGVNAIEATPRGVVVTALPAAGEMLRRHLVLLDTRIEHSSGMNNWEVVRRFLDGDRETREHMNRINDCAYRMRDALGSGDWRAAALALDDEWSARRLLAPVVSNSRIDAMVAEARGRGALAAKICGAGGGGCLALLVPDAERFAGGIAFRPDPHGLEVSSE